MLRPIETLSRYASHDATMPGLLESRRKAGPDRPFLVDGARSWTYGRFAADVAAAARLLADRGVVAGDRVALLAPTVAETVIAFFAAARLGAMFVPLNAELKREEARPIVARARPRVLIHAAELEGLARDCAGDGATTPTLLAIGRDFGGFDRLPALDAAVPPPRPETTCIVLFTSGTTGTPKGVMQAQRTFVVAGEGFVERQWLQPDDRMLCILPMFHVNALFYSLGGALAAGATLVLGGKFSASRFWPLARESAATQVNMLGSIGKILSLRPRGEYVPGHRLDRVYCVPMPGDVQRVFREEFGVRWIAEGYGMSEVPGILAQPYGEPPAVGTMGRVCRHPDGRALGRIRVVDEAGRDVPVGEPGTLLVKTELAMQGYFEEPERTAASLNDGFFITGDRVREVAPGTYAFVARDKDMIRRRGENIAAVEIDQAALGHPDVGEAAAVAVPSELGEDDILLAVVPRAGCRVDATALRAFLATRLTAAKLPRFVAVVDAVPYGPTQRVLRFKLAADAALRAAAVDFEAPGAPR
ncbi:MAG: AMP-binding protein [Phreatobacter sp.]|uniref:AMP-binding protein n=1 Tax=Phreatobacter sp. TaxID=1966341 RepID=UPI001A56590C|nr:AMP-binding protein [Phreatobacter sp.]MBL8571856.1 AMP-binding protein [Phreatobacter sp.]